MSTPKITALYEHRSDGRAYVVVSHGCMAEHIRLIDGFDAAPAVVAREFPQITLAEAERQCAEVRKA